jgi:hypothetical protein
MTRSRAGLFCVVRFALCLLALAAHPAAAHDRTTSYSTWDIRGRSAQVTVRLSALDVTRFPWAATAGADLDRMLGDYLPQHLQLLADAKPCPVTDGPRRLSAAPGRVVFEWRVACPNDGTLAIRSAVLFDVAPAHLHFARLTRDGTHAQERVLSDAERLWRLSEASPQQRTVEPSGTSLGGYITLGIAHILSGYDHLAFLLALLLIGSSLREVAQVVTGFTLAHSITLGLTVLGYVHPDRAPVEALIGLSIALVAAENAWLVGRRSRTIPWVIAAALVVLALLAARGHGQVPALTLAGLALFSLCYFGLLQRQAHAGSMRWAIAFIFGLVHGCGFAAVLGEAGLPPDRVVHALLGFNIGVELGQLAVVALVWPLLQWVTHRRAQVRAAIIEVGSAAVLALGVFWFVTRTFG